MAYNVGGVVLSAPAATVNIEVGQSFQMTIYVTGGGGGAPSAYDLIHQCDLGGGYITIPTSSGGNGLWTDGDPDILNETTVIYDISNPRTINVYGDKVGTYTIQAYAYRGSAYTDGPITVNVNSATTAPPTTAEPTTEAPTTLAPTTLAPTTLAPTTLAPTTLAPTTPAPCLITQGPYGSSIDDDFNRVENPLSTNWVTALGGLYSMWASNGAEAYQPAAANGYTLSVYGISKARTCEVFLTVTAKPPDGETLALGIIQGYNTAADFDGYLISFIPQAGTDSWSLDVVTNGVISSNIDSGSFELTNGDAIAIVAKASGIVEAWHYTSGSWVLRLSGTDSTWAGPFYPYIVGTDTSLGIRFDCFGAEEGITTTAPPTTIAPTTEAPTTLAPTTLAPTTLAPTTPAGCDFYDGFEDGTAGKWNEAYTVSIRNTGAAEGTYCAELTQSYSRLYSDVGGSASQVHLKFKWKGGAGWTGGETVDVAFRYVSTNQQILRFNSADNTISIYCGGAWRQTSVACLTPGSWHDIELWLDIDNVTGQLIVDVDGVRRIDFYGDTQGGYSAFTRLYFLSYTFVDSVCYDTSSPVIPTHVPTTAAPTTVAPTTLAPTTLEPTTLAPTTVAPTTCPPVDYYSDFTEASPLDNFTERWQLSYLAPAIQDSGETYKVGSKNLFMNTNSNPETLLSFDSPGTPVDAELLVLASLNDLSGTPTGAIFVLRGSGATDAEYGYLLRPLQGSGFVAISKMINGTLSNIDSWSANFGGTEIGQAWVRFRVQGNELKAKIWRAYELEPAEWQFETTDSDITSGGWVGVGTNYNIADYYVEYIGVTTCGGTHEVPALTDGQVNNYLGTGYFSTSARVYVADYVRLQPILVPPSADGKYLKTVSVRPYGWYDYSRVALYKGSSKTSFSDAVLVEDFGVINWTSLQWNSVNLTTPQLVSDGDVYYIGVKSNNTNLDEVCRFGDNTPGNWLMNASHLNVNGSGYWVGTAGISTDETAAWPADLTGWSADRYYNWLAVRLELDDELTTVPPTTVAPTTQEPTTLAPTTLAPTTLAPTTLAPTTLAPTTLAPTTVAPTTAAPTTLAPTTLAPTTLAPTTPEPCYIGNKTAGTSSVYFPPSSSKVASRYQNTTGHAVDISKMYAVWDIDYLAYDRRAIIYSDNSGSPDALLAESVEVSSSSANVPVEFTFASPVRIESGEYFWLGIHAPSQMPTYNCRVRANGIAYNSDTYADGASDPFGSPTWASFEYVIWTDCDVALATTLAPTTLAPTTIAPTTIAPTTLAPTTEAPTTLAPTTEAPTTLAPTTAAPTTAEPTTLAPTTVAPTTLAPTTGPPCSSKRWRLYVTDTEDHNDISLPEMEMRESIGGADQCSGGTVTESTHGPFALNPGANAFDDSLSSFWNSDAAPPQWVEYEFASEKTIVQYVLKSANYNTTQMPMDFQLQYWNGISWVTVSDVTGETGWSGVGDNRTFTTDCYEGATTTAPTTSAPTTLAETTVAPTTVAPTTLAPTTVAPSSLAPTTVAATTLPPVTLPPTTVVPTTAIVTTVVPSTLAPTTLLSTVVPTTVVPTTAPPVICTQYAYSLVTDEDTVDSIIVDEDTLISLITDEDTLESVVC